MKQLIEGREKAGSQVISALRISRNAQASSPRIEILTPLGQDTTGAALWGIDLGDLIKQETPLEHCRFPMGERRAQPGLDLSWSRGFGHDRYGTRVSSALVSVISTSA
jgi:hypothetical protein